MAGNTSAWSSVVPSGTSSIRQGDDDIRSTKSILEASLSEEHYFVPGASASSSSGGLHKPGSARIYAGTRASLTTPSSADSAGRLYFSTDLESLHYIGSSSHSTIVGGKHPIGARASGPSGTYSSGAGGNLVTFATEDFDVGDMFSASSTRINLSSAGSGRYLVQAYLSFTDSVHTGAIREIQLLRSSVTLAVESSGTQPGSTRPIALNASFVDHSNATATFYQVLVIHDAGVTLTASSLTGWLAVQKL